MLQAGRELIEASGNLDDLSINDIVERAGTSIGAFYRRFDNKDAFFDVLQDAAMEAGLEHVREAVERDIEVPRRAVPTGAARQQPREPA